MLTAEHAVWLKIGIGTIIGVGVGAVGYATIG